MNGTSYLFDFELFFALVLLGFLALTSQLLGGKL